MALNWINVEEFSFNCLLMMEAFQIRLLCESLHGSAEKRGHLGIALRYNPAVLWYTRRMCPEHAATLAELAKQSAGGLDAGAIRASELFILSSIEDFVTYTRPELMDTGCNFIYGWDKYRLFEMADFSGKRVLDVGSGSGRLAFAAAERAREVYACEPVGTLRAYLQQRIAREGIANMRVMDGFAHSLAYPDNTFDIVMSGHVVGDDFDSEIAELTRVARPGGWLIDCPGEDDRRRAPGGELEQRGWECLHYVSKFGGDVYRYRKQIHKN